MKYLVLLLKYRPQEDNTIFLQQSFRFRGWGGVIPELIIPDVYGLILISQALVFEEEETDRIKFETLRN